MGRNPSAILGFKLKGLNVWTSQDRSDPLILRYGKITTAINTVLDLPSTFMSERARIGLWVPDRQLLARADCDIGFPDRLAMGRLQPRTINAGSWDFALIP